MRLITKQEAARRQPRLVLEAWIGGLPTERVQRSLGLALAGSVSTKATSTLGSPRAGSPPLASPPTRPLHQ